MRPLRGDGVRLMARGRWRLMDVENPHFVKTNCAPLKTAYGDFSRRSICFSSSHRPASLGCGGSPVCLAKRERAFS
jgi:hypothetical protein